MKAQIIHRIVSLDEDPTPLAAKIPIIPEVETYPLSEANAALLALRQRHVRSRQGAGHLRPRLRARVHGAPV